jgi:hypothetical protein
MKSSSPVKLQGYWMMGEIAKGIDPFSSPTKHRGCRNNVENDAVSIPGQFAGVVRHHAILEPARSVVVPGQFAGVVRGYCIKPLFRKQISALACA